MPDKAFLEQYPLYRRLQKKFYGTLDNLDRVSISMPCQVCSSKQTFLMQNAYYEGYKVANVTIEGTTCHLRYVCMGCQTFTHHFYVRFGPNATWVMKVGQMPPWDIAPDPDLAAALGDNASLYSKGLVCESQSYGVGAFAYYRRIVEIQIDQLLADVESLIPESERPAYKSALAKTKETKVAQEKIALVKDLLPPILRPEGMNPLAVLHDALSDGLHGRSDEECLALAAEIREILVFLVGQIAATTAAAKGFTGAMRRLLEKKARTST